MVNVILAFAGFLLVVELIHAYFAGKYERAREGRVWRERFFAAAEHLADDERTTDEELQSLRRDVPALNSKLALISLSEALRARANGRIPKSDKTSDDIPEDLRDLWLTANLSFLVALTFNLPLIGVDTRARLVEFIGGANKKRKTAEALVWRVTQKANKGWHLRRA